MKSLAQAVNRSMEVIKQTGLNTPSCNPQETRALSLRDDADGRLALLNLVNQCFNSLHTYGKAPEQLRDTGSMFCMVLADYSIEQVRSAFAYYVKTKTEMPTPADIVNIVERGDKPAFDRSVYVSIDKKPPETRTSADWAYLRDYERFVVTGKFS